ncbi:MAG: Atxe2 family lasso peptide isopeptidase [Lysobacteraceae bacterium]
MRAVRRGGLGLAFAALGAAVAAGEAGAASPRQLVETVDFSSPVVSPDGGQVAFRVVRPSIERNTHDTVWYVQPMDGSAPPRRVADGGLPLRDSAGIEVPATVVWSPDSTHIHYRARVDGAVGVWRAAADGSGARPVTRDAADVTAFELDAGGRELRYRVGPTRRAVREAEQAEYDRGIRVDRSTPLGQGLFRSGYTEGRLATQRLGQIFNRVPLLDAVPQRWKAVDIATGATRELAASEAPSEGPGLPAPLVDLPGLWLHAHEPQGGRVAFLTRHGGSEAPATTRLGVARGGRSPGLVWCEAEACAGGEVSGVQWRPGRGEVVFTVTRYGQGYAQSIHRWDVDSGDVLPVAASSGMLQGELRWGPGSCGVSAQALACVTALANRPPRLERIDLDTGQRQVLHDPNRALARDLARVPVRLLRWSDGQGRAFTGQFHPARHTGDRPPPLFVTYYRCMGFVRGGSGDEWPLAALAQHGVATLCINAPWFSGDAVARYDLGRSAVESAVDLLARQGSIDRRRVGMGGLSFGSEVTMWTLIHTDLVAAASMASPTTSQMQYLLGSNLGEAFEDLRRSHWQLGPPGQTPEQWRRLSPASNLDRIRAPVLMQFPEQEYIHGLDFAIPLMLRAQADLYVFPHAPHNKFQPRHKLAAYQRNLDWFGFWLLDAEDPDPGKAEQYAHWRAMRAALRDGPASAQAW